MAFLAGVNAIYTDRNMASDATWRAGGTGLPVPVRVVTRKPDAVMNYGESRVTTATMLIHVRASEVEAPRSGDTFLIGSALFCVMGQPERDSLGLTWRCEATRV